jgi:monoterpene epsilon-lactone hydrolase
MPSLRQQLHLARVLLRASFATIGRPRPDTWTLRQAITVAGVRTILDNVVDLAAPTQRARMQMPGPPVPKGVTRTERTYAGRRALHYSTKDSDQSSLILHFHGGGYVVGDVDDNDGYLGALCLASGMPVLTFDYRLAPEHPYPAAIEDAVAAVIELVAQGLDPARVVLTGDSAGGGLSLATLLALRDRDGPQLAGASLGSPWIDLRGVGVNDICNLDTDYLTVAIITRWRDMYVGEHDPAEPMISPAAANLAGLPPLQFVIGEAELLANDIERCAERSIEAGVSTEIVRGHQAAHVWYRQVNGELPGPSDTIETMARFLHRCVGPPA